MADTTATEAFEGAKNRIKITVPHPKDGSGIATTEIAFLVNKENRALVLEKIQATTGTSEAALVTLLECEQAVMKIFSVQKNTHGGYHGSKNSWFDTGQQRFEGNYINGRGDGRHRAWNEDGELSNVKIYKKGKLSSFEIYESGQVVCSGVSQKQLDEWMQAKPDLEFKHAIELSGLEIEYH